MTGLTKKEIKDFLDEKYDQYNNPQFVPNDPISIPHLFTKKEDIEIAGFLAATIAWGNRASIVKNANRLVHWMDLNPHEFIQNASARELEVFSQFVHRTFNGTDTIYFLQSLQNIYRLHGGMEKVFSAGFELSGNLFGTLTHFRTVFLELPHEHRTEKHLANVAKKSSGKRLCMYLRWMVRNDKRGVDFGLWRSIPSSVLMLPLDLHTGNVSRKLGLLNRKQNDWQAVEEITAQLRQFDPVDPIKYDFALFGLGINDNF